MPLKIFKPLQTSRFRKGEPYLKTVKGLMDALKKKGMTGMLLLKRFENTNSETLFTYLQRKHKFVSEFSFFFFFFLLRVAFQVLHALRKVCFEMLKVLPFSDHPISDIS